VDNELEVIRTQMEQTRSSLAGKLEALESEFRDTVEGATSAVETVQETVANVKDSVQETVESVKETVQETVETVKETLDIRRQVARHPWAMFGGAVMAGCFAGFLVGGRRKSSKPAAVAETGKESTPLRNGSGHRNGAARKTGETPSSSEESGLLQSGARMLKGLAVGTVMSVLRDVLVEAVPSDLAADVARAVDDVTTRLGGKPLRRDDESNESGNESEGDTPHGESESTEMGRPVGTARWAR